MSIRIKIKETSGEKRITATSKPIILIGRSSRCDIRLISDMVSSTHARVKVYRDSIAIEDMGSSNGTFINGARIEGAVEFGVTDVVQLGTGGPTIQLVSGFAEVASASPLDTEDRPTQRPSWSFAIGATVTLFVIAGMCLIPVAFFGGIAFLSTTPSPVSQPPSPVSQPLDAAAIFKQHGSSTYLVCLKIEDRPGVIPFGTAFAISADGLFGTNGHVVQGMKEQGRTLQADLDAEGRDRSLEFLLISPGGADELKITDSLAHRLYIDDPENGPDVGVLQADVSRNGKLRPIPLATDSELQSLGLGSQICYIGYPAFYDEDYDKLKKIVPRTFVGNIVRLMDFHKEQADFKDAKLIEHNMYSWGGASGSPIFNATGSVVAVHFAGLPVQDAETGEFKKQQASIKYGIRADALREVAAAYEKSR